MGLFDQRRKIGIEARFPITTLDRLLSTPAVRAVIGLTIQDHKLYTALPAEEVIKPLTRIVRDLANKTVTVTDLKKRDQQVGYATKLGADLPDLSKAAEASKPVDGMGADEFKAKLKTKASLNLRPSHLLRGGH